VASSRQVPWIVQTAMGVVFAAALHAVFSAPPSGAQATSGRCAVNNGGCPAAMECLDGPTQAFCGYCPSGYVTVGNTCQDVDECGADNGGCGTETCTNAPGGWLCGASCPPGFTGTPETGCRDINECAVDIANNGGCDWLTECVNTAGWRTCGSCPDGHEGSGYLGCKDVNDCPRGGCGIRDTLPPVFTTPADVTLSASVPEGAVGRFTVTALDNVDGRVSVECAPASGSVFPRGTTDVTCTARDAAGNAGTATLRVIVQ
jgi:hypothetical protein